MRRISANDETSFAAMEKRVILESRMRIREIYQAMANELRSWDIRSAFAGGAASALVYVTFLKYISDKREELNLKVSDLYRFDALCSLYPQVVDQRELSEYLGDVEEQLGLSNRLLETFVEDIKNQNLEIKFSNVLKLASYLDFSSKDMAELAVDELISVVEMLIDSEGKVSGLTYTPEKLGAFLSGVCHIQDGMSVYDPCAGIGVSLVQAVKRGNVSVFAQEKNMHRAAILEMLLIMNGIRSGRVQCDDSILHPLSLTLQKKFDRIVSEPPYLRPEVGYRVSIVQELFDHILYYPRQRIEDVWVIVRHIVAALEQGGRAAVLVPMSMLTREGSVVHTREMLLQDGFIEAVVELPSSVFTNRGIKTSVIVLQKECPKQSVYMLDLSRGLWDEKSKNGEDGINELVQMVLEHQIEDGVSRIVGIEEIVRNNYQLAVARYVKPSIDVEQFLSDSEKLYKKADLLEKRFSRICNEFKEALAEYNGYCSRNQ